MKISIFLFVFLLFCSSVSFGQKSFYTLLQGGGQLGFANEGYEGAFSGYNFHFVFGQNFNESAFVGLGLGNETYRGKYRTNDPNDADQTQRTYDTYMMPIFVDGRLPIGYLGRSGRVGLLANAGYAPKIGPVYDKGFLFKGGFFYLYETLGRTHYTASFSYGYQQLTRNGHHPGRDFQNQSFVLSIGLMFK